MSVQLRLAFWVLAGVVAGVLLTLVVERLGNAGLMD